MTKNPPTKAVKIAFGINLALAVMFVLIAGTTTFAQTGHTKKSQADKAASKAADEDADEYESVQVAGQTVAIDKKTGKLRQPTREEAKALAEGMKEMVNQSSEGLTPIYHADGSVSVDLQDRFMNIAVAKKNPDGTITDACVSSVPEVNAFLGVKAKAKKSARSKSKAVRKSSVRTNRTAAREESTNEKY